jgi:phosphoglycolate phosphatase
MTLPSLDKYHHVLWDWNGTLLNDAWICVDIMNGLLYDYGKPGLTLTRYQQIFDFPVRDYYEQLGFDFNITPFEKVGSEFMDEYYRRWRLCTLQSHAFSVLHWIQQKKIPQSVLSAASVTLVRDGLSHFQLEPFFEHVNGLDHHYADGKLTIAQAFMERLALSPETVLLIGDTTHDFHVAQSVGIDCILFKGGHHAPARLQACGVPLCTSLQELIS